MILIYISCSSCGYESTMLHQAITNDDDIIICPVCRSESVSYKKEVENEDN